MSRSFSADISAFVRKAKGNTEKVVRKIVFDVGTKIVMRSPVGDRELWASNIARAERNLPPMPKGYVGGRFRANWQYGYGTIPGGDLPDVDASGASSTMRILAGVRGNPAGGIHYLVNNLPYAKRLEDGHSTQAPAGMVALTAAEFQAIARASQP